MNDGQPTGTAAPLSNLDVAMMDGMLASLRDACLAKWREYIKVAPEYNRLTGEMARLVSRCVCMMVAMGHSEESAKQRMSAWQHGEPTF